MLAAGVGVMIGNSRLTLGLPIRRGGLSFWLLPMLARPGRAFTFRTGIFTTGTARIVRRAWRVWDNRAVSPRSCRRPPGRGRRRQPNSRLQVDHAAPGRPADRQTPVRQHAGTCWFDKPAAGDRRSWAAPPGNGIYRGMDLELLDPGDDEELGFLIEALHHDGPGHARQ